MHLRVTGESDTFVYATSPISFGGLNQEDLLFWMAPMALVNNITGESMYAFLAGCFCLWFYKRLTRKKHAGFLLLKASVSIGKLQKSDLAMRFPALKTLARTLNNVSAKVWMDKGLLPSHTYCNVYEP